jgi:hypothetical protein
VTRTAPDNVEAFPDYFSKLSAATNGSRLAIYGNIEFAGTVSVADPVAIRARHFKGESSLGGYVRSLQVSTALSAEAACGVTSDQSTSTITDSQARFRGKVVILNFDRNEVLGAVPPRC